MVGEMKDSNPHSENRTNLIEVIGEGERERERERERESERERETHRLIDRDLDTNCVQCCVYSISTHQHHTLPPHPPTHTHEKACALDARARLPETQMARGDGRLPHSHSSGYQVEQHMTHFFSHENRTIIAEINTQNTTEKPETGRGLDSEFFRLVGGRTWEVFRLVGGRTWEVFRLAGGRTWCFLLCFLR